VSRLMTAASGQQHQAAPGARQQRADLLVARRVIKQQQDLLACHVITPSRGPGLQPRRDLRRGDPRGQQQAGQRVCRVHRPLATRVCVQWQVELAVGKPVRQLVGRVHREGGLADPGHPADRAYPHDPAARRQALQPLRQPVEVGLAAGEAGDVARQPASRRRGERPRSRLLPGPHHVAGRAPPAGRSHEQLCDAPAQAKRSRQQHRALPARGPVDAPLQITDRARAQARGFRQLLLRQPGL